MGDGGEDGRGGEGEDVGVEIPAKQKQDEHQQGSGINAGSDVDAICEIHKFMADGELRSAPKGPGVTSPETVLNFSSETVQALNCPPSVSSMLQGYGWDQPLFVYSPSPVCRPLQFQPLHLPSCTMVMLH